MFHNIRLHPLLSTFRADDVLLVRYEALAHQTGGAGGAAEAGVVPLTTFKGDEPCAANT